MAIYQGANDQRFLGHRRRRLGIFAQQVDGYLVRGIVVHDLGVILAAAQLNQIAVMRTMRIVTVFMAMLVIVPRVGTHLGWRGRTAGRTTQRHPGQQRGTQHSGNSELAHGLLLQK